MGREWRHARKRWGIEGFEKKTPVSWDSDLGEARRLCALRALRVGWVSWSWDLNSERESRISELTEARPVVYGGGAAHAGVQMEKSA